MYKAFVKQSLKLFSRFIFWIALLLILLFLGIKFIAPYGIHKYGEQYGLGFKDISVTMTGVRAEGITFSQGTIESITIKYDLDQLTRRHIKSLIIEGLDFSLDLSAKDKLGGKLDLSTAFVIDEIEIPHIKGKIAGISYENIILEPILLSGHVKGSYKKEKGLEGKLNLEFLPHTNFQKGHLEIDIKNNQPETDLSLNKLTYPITDAVFDLHLKGQMEEQLFVFEGFLQEETTKLMTFEGATNYNDHWEIKTTIPPLSIGPTTKPLSHYWKDVPEELKSFSGTLALESRIKLIQGNLTQAYQLNLKDGTLLYDKISASGINTSMTLSNLLPLTASPSKLNVKEVVTPFGPLKNLTSDIKIEKGHIALSDVKAAFVRGGLQLDHFQLYPIPNSQELNILVNHLSLDDLIASLDISGLSLTGQISGHLPTQLYQDQTFAIDNATLNTDGTGVLSYKWATAEQSDNANLQLTAKALKNFMYKSIQITVNKVRDKNLNAVVSLLGHNPNVLSGREFDIKVDLSGDILQTITATWEAFQGQQDLWRKKVTGR